MVASSAPDGGSDRAPGRSAAARYGDRLDGRLDLDRLDEEQPLDLDVLGDDDRPRLTERLGLVLEERGVLPWLRSHRVITWIAAGVVAVALAAAGGWWVTRPPSLGDPRVTVTTGGNEAARMILDPATGEATAISQLVLVGNGEGPGTLVDTLGVEGPGLSDPQARVITASSGDTVTGAVTSQIDCATPDSTRAVVDAAASDYRVLVRRTSAQGEVREDTVPLSGAEEWLTDVRQACVQIAADRDLTVTLVESQAVAGVIAADVRMRVRNAASTPWRSVRASSSASPAVVSYGPDVDIPAGGEAWVDVRLWPDDCAHPLTALSAGVPLRATVAGAATVDARAPSFTLPLGRAALDTVAGAVTAICSATPPTATVVRARVAGGAGTDSAGIVSMAVDVTAPDAFLVEVEDRAPGPSGRVSPLSTPVVVQDGVARIDLHWELPQCFDLLAAGGPKVAVRLVVGGLRRPYLLPLGGSALQLNVTRLCGPTVASVIR